MPAWRILRLARTSRWAIVGSGTRNARAISAVVRPGKRAQRQRDLGIARQRRVTAREDEAQAVVVDAAVVATRRIVAIVGCVGPRGHGHLLRASRPPSRRAADDRAHDCARSSSSQAPGLRGTPSRGQRSSARANASCAHSSARSQSPVTRIRVATTRPQSERNAAATAPSTCAVAGGSHLPDRPHFDRAALAPGIFAAISIASSRSLASTT